MPIITPDTTPATKAIKIDVDNFDIDMITLVSIQSPKLSFTLSYVNIIKIS